MNEAGRLGLKVVTEGAAVLGAPVGIDQFIADDINKRLLQLTQDLARACAGIKQGDPLCTLFFAAAIQAV